ncbi:MAG: amino acid permease, partial [Elusimicrobia bacterium]|nr:amino acid permease [Elusimicrobiota bacterium]
MTTQSENNPPSITGILRVKQVAVLTTAVLTFIPFWKAGAVVLCDLGSSAFYAGGIAMQAFGGAFPWYILLVMLFAGAMLMVYVESCSMFVRGGVYRAVKEGLGHNMAKISVSALMFDYVLTGPISAVSAGHYLAGLVSSIFSYAGMQVHIDARIFSAVFAVLVTIFFWRQNIKGIEESSDASVKIMGFVSVVGATLIIWSVVTVCQRGFTLPKFDLNFNSG